MTKPRLLITGAAGTIGTVLSSRLTDFELTLADRPEYDFTGSAVWRALLPGQDTVLHLAWEPTRTSTDGIAPSNFAMNELVFREALAAGVKRVLYASSVHADDFFDEARWPLSPVAGGTPTSSYGALKQHGEALGRWAAKQGLEVVALRFGGVNAADTEPTDPHERAVWLRHADCEAFVRGAVTTPVTSKSCLVAYGVSDNPTRRHLPAPWLP